MERENSPAFLALRHSVRRLLAYVEQQVQQHGGSVTLYDDQLNDTIPMPDPILVRPAT
jgi:hypothetical protein